MPPGAGWFRCSIGETLATIADVLAEAGEDAATIYSNIRSPQYFMATSDTSDTLRPGGLADQLIETVRSEEARLVALHAYTTYTRHNTLSPADVF